MKTKNSEKIGLFGGTFNPIHYGHMNSAETVKKALGLNKLIFIPAAQNPNRQQTEGPTPEERLSMVKMATADLGGEAAGFFSSDIEVKRQGLSYTIETVTELESENQDLHLIVGADQFWDFDQWKDYKKIIEKVNLVVTSRPGNDLPENLAELPVWTNDLLSSFTSGKGIFPTGKKLLFVQLEDKDISGEEIRSKARRMQDVSEYTSAGVCSFIQTERLYNRISAKIPDFEKFAKFCAGILDDQGGINALGFDVRELQQPTEYTLVASGTSTRHTKALGEHIIRQVKKQFHCYPQGAEGLSEGRWVVIDYGSLMIHLFYDFVRNEYRMEDLWAKGKKLEL